MSKLASVLFYLVLIVPVIYVGSAGAEDDDIQASVYLVFDPDTGEFVMVDDASITAQHKAQQDQEAIDSVVETADGPSESRTTWMIGAAAALVDAAARAASTRPDTGIWQARATPSSKASCSFERWPGTARITE